MSHLFTYQCHFGNWYSDLLWNC
uniref:Uncharacterized protein n=1 Tax=Arundo donax TaxID=35708 RepID=A0A0A9FPS4_ARUDO